MSNLFCFIDCNKNSKLPVFSCPKNYVPKANGKLILGSNIKINFVIYENHFDSDDIEQQVIKKDDNQNIIL